MNPKSKQATARHIIKLLKTTNAKKWGKDPVGAEKVKMNNQ